MPHYVTDPERLLAGTGYLMDVSMHGDRRDDDDGGRWRLLVLEDAGERWPSPRAPEAGQGRSRMFNLTDGLLGQSVRCALLITTNEPLDRLHPAVRRPGCCWAQVGFTPFAPAEAPPGWPTMGARRPCTRPPRWPSSTRASRAAPSGEEEPGEGFGFALRLAPDGTHSRRRYTPEQAIRKLR